MSSDLQALCERQGWPEPLYEVHHDGNEYNCTVTVNNKYNLTVHGYPSETKAKEIAGLRVYMVIQSSPDGGGSHDGPPNREGVLPLQTVPSGEISYVHHPALSSNASTYYSAMSGRASHDESFSASRTPWYLYLERVKLVPLPDFEENNWSGRGQHAEFHESEKAELDAILSVKGYLGHSATALIEKVQCKRILLARKKTKCDWRHKREEVIKEVIHLEKLRHSHIVRGVGTYVLGNELSILLYPATEYNLESFLDACDMKRTSSSPSDTGTDAPAPQARLLYSLLGFFQCLANTMRFVHENRVKHMDIKPPNVLIKEDMRESAGFKVYLADFGISRSYKESEDVETDSITACTRTYAAPEVIEQESRGFGADIFSLGCVFLEMLAVLCHPRRRRTLFDLRDGNSQNDRSYQANVGTIFATEIFREPGFAYKRCFPWLREVERMVSLDPHNRPTASDLCTVFGNGGDCCHRGSVPFEAEHKKPSDRYRNRGGYN